VLHRTYPVLLGALTLSFLVVTAGWALLTPPFHTPDETQHFNSVLRVVRGDGWPPPGTAFRTVGVETAMEEAALERWNFLTLAEVTPVPRDERSVVTYSDTPTEAVDQMTQHPPGYYTVAAGFLWALGAEDWRWDDQVLVLRLLSVVLLAPVVPLAAAAALELTGSRPAALAGATFPLLVPQFGHIGGSVSNDSLTVLAGCAITLLAARAAVRGAGPGLVVALGVALGIGLLSKGFLLPAVPVVAVAVLLAAPRRLRWMRAGLALAVAFAVGGWWWLRNLLVFGRVQPDSGLYVDAAEPATTGFVAFASRAAQALAVSFWGNFGWLALPSPRWWWLTGQLLLVLCAVAAMVWAVRNRRGVALVTLWMLPAVTLAVVLWGAYASHIRTGEYYGLQGRYLFSSIVVMGVTVAAAVALLPERTRRWVPAAATWSAAAVSVAALDHVLTGMYAADGADRGTAWDRWAGWAAVPGWVLAAAATALLLTLVTSAVMSTAVALARDRGAAERPHGQAALEARELSGS
jgi:4-amino-4-deoxy-L-arabinose transferase-like glycosyltransferase